MYSGSSITTYMEISIEVYGFLFAQLSPINDLEQTTNISYQIVCFQITIIYQVLTIVQFEKFSYIFVKRY